MTTIPHDDDGPDLTVELLQDAEAVRKIREGEAEIARGEVVGKAELDRLMAARRPREDAADVIAARRALAEGPAIPADEVYAELGLDDDRRACRTCQATRRK